MGKKQKKQNPKTQHQNQPSKVDDKSIPAVTTDASASASGFHVEPLQVTDAQTAELVSPSESLSKEAPLTTFDKAPSLEEEKPVQALDVKDSPSPKSKKSSTKTAVHLTVGSSIQKGGKSGTVVWIGKYPDGRKMKVKWESGSFEIVAEKDLV
jgi:hypothetical protein